MRGGGEAHFVDEDIILGQVSMHQVALLVQLADNQHKLRVEDLHLLLRGVCILQNTSHNSDNVPVARKKACTNITLMKSLPVTPQRHRNFQGHFERLQKAA
jgi:hypothetical protein